MQNTESPWIVAIGASGGDGLDDIRDLLMGLPESLTAIVMVVLHRGWHQHSELRSVLARSCVLPVVVAGERERLRAGNIYIGEPSAHLALASNTFGRLVGDPERHHGNRTVDLLFKSIAKYAGTRIIGVVLSGSLDDGSRGLEAIHHAGGKTMVLTPSSHLWRGMPENAIAYDGPIDLIGSPAQIAKAICAACAP